MENCRKSRKFQEVPGYGKGYILEVILKYLQTLEKFLLICIFI